MLSLDCNGSVCVPNDRELNGDLVFAVSNHIIQPFGVAGHLKPGQIYNLVVEQYSAHGREIVGGAAMFLLTVTDCSLSHRIC